MRRVSEVMSAPVCTVDASEVVGSVRDLMLGEGIHGIPVLDDGGGVVGLITSSDMVEEWAPEMGVATVMSTEVRTAAPDTTLVEAARLMLADRLHHLVVIERGAVVGMVTSFDLLRELAGEVEAASSLPTASRRVAHPGDLVVIRGHAIDARERRGVIVEARGEGGGPPFVVRWLDDPHDEPHDVLFFTGSDADIEPAGKPDPPSA